MVAPPGATFQNNINDLIFAHQCYACEIQKHTKHTLFACFGREIPGSDTVSRTQWKNTVI